jgi:hypothetical protein
MRRRTLPEEGGARASAHLETTEGAMKGGVLAGRSGGKFRGGKFRCA